MKEDQIKRKIEKLQQRINQLKDGRSKISVDSTINIEIDKWIIELNRQIFNLQWKPFRPRKENIGNKKKGLDENIHSI